MQKHSITDSPVLSSQLVWRVDEGTITSGQGSSEVEVIWTNPGRNGIFVSRQNFCGNSETSFMEVIVDKLASTNQEISGDGKICQGSSYPYSLLSKSGITYTWNVIGGTITAGRASASILVERTSEDLQSISVIQENEYGKTNAIQKLI